jgi:hypothetical protein
MLLIAGNPVNNLNVPKLLNAPRDQVEKSLGKAYKPRMDPGYFFTPKAYDLIRVNDFGPAMNAVVISFKELLTPDQTLARLGFDPKKATAKPLPNPTNTIVMLVRQRWEITLSGLPHNTKSHKPWVLEYEQDGHGNSLRAKSLKDAIQVATGTKRIELIQSCYDWRTKLVIDSR